MSNKNVIRAWKDPAYRNSLGEAERASLPVNPAGSIEISEAELGNVAGGQVNLTQIVYCFPTVNCTFRCITYFLSCTCKIFL